MLTFLGIVHIVIALLLIFLVLVQDSKGGMGALGGGGGGGANSVLGAAGAENILAKMTRWTAVGFAISCILLTIYSTRGGSSVVDDFVPTAPAAQESAVPAEAPATGAGAVPAADAPKADDQN